MSNAEQPFYRRPLWIVVAIFLAVALVGGGIAIATSVMGGRNNNTAAEPTSAQSSTGSSLPDGAQSVCGLKGYEATSSLTSAPKATWDLVGTVAVPKPDGAGPGATDSDGLRTCYSHTAKGALYAVVNYYAQSTDARLIPHLPDLVAPGAGKDAALKKDDGSSDTPSSTRLQVAGFKVNSYTANEATIDVVWTVTSQQNALVSMPMVLKWVDGDWKIALTDSGELPFAASQVQSLGGYIPWTSGV
jgi:hypothetical protein